MVSDLTKRVPRTGTTPFPKISGVLSFVRGMGPLLSMPERAAGSFAGVEHAFIGALRYEDAKDGTPRLKQDKSRLIVKLVKRKSPAVHTKSKRNRG